MVFLHLFLDFFCVCFKPLFSRTDFRCVYFASPSLFHFSFYLHNLCSLLQFFLLAQNVISMPIPSLSSFAPTCFVVVYHRQVPSYFVHVERAIQLKQNKLHFSHVMSICYSLYRAYFNCGMFRNIKLTENC